MVVYLVTSIFETEPGQFKKYTMAYESLDAALEYVELDMAAQYEGMYAEVLTDDIKDLVRMRGDFFFKYGEMPHYIMIERLDVHNTLPENVDNVVRFSLSEHMIEPVEEEAEPEAEAEEESESEDEESEEETDTEESTEAPSSNIPIVESPEANMEESPEANMEDKMEELPMENTAGMTEESDTVTPPVENNSLSANSVVSAPSGANIVGLDEEEEEMPSPETITMESDSNMGTNMTSNMGTNMESSNENMNTSASAESNIPAALRTATGGKRSAKRSTRRKGGKGKRATRKV